MIVSPCGPPPKRRSTDDRKPPVPLRVVTHRDTLLTAEADELGAVDVDHMLVDVIHLEPPAVEPVHDLLVAHHAGAFEETAESTLRGHAAYPTEYLADDLDMRDGSDNSQTLYTQDDTDDKVFDDRFRFVCPIRALLGNSYLIQHATEINPFHLIVPRRKPPHAEMYLSV
jgi:hypothetical protein